jgi:hypothetical protein
MRLLSFTLFVQYQTCCRCSFHLQNMSRTVHITVVTFVCAARRGCFCPLPLEGADLP